MIEIRFLIPTADNDGVVFTEAHHAAFVAKGVDLFGGFSREANEVVGEWSDGRFTYRDTLRVYFAAVASIVDGGKVGDAATFAKAHYRQLAIYVRYLGLSEIL